jgi:penicillin-insensitive murein endopeptidase
MRTAFLVSACLAAALTGAAVRALAQDKGALDPAPLPPLADPADPKLPAKELFGRAMTPTEVLTRSIGFYARGCLAGAKALPIDGETWQVMRLSRNRNWGHPAMIAFLERFSRKAAREGVWPGILVGDISQPRGGPMLPATLRIRSAWTPTCG